MNKTSLLLTPAVTMMCFALSACGGDDVGGTPSSAASTTSSTGSSSSGSSTTGSTTGGTSSGSTTTTGTGSGSTSTGSGSTGGSGSTTTGGGSTGTTTPPSSGSGSGGSSTTTSVSTGALSGTLSGGAGISVNLVGTTTQSTTTDSSGNFSFTALAAGTYTVVPTAAGHIFYPVSAVESIGSATVSDIDFVAKSTSSATYNISGTVSGAVASGVIVTLNGANVGSAVTDQSGNYIFAGLAAGTYTVNASQSGDVFTQSQTITLGTTDSTANNFTSAASAGDGLSFTVVNPLPQATIGSTYSNSVVQSISGGTSPYHYQTDVMASGTPPLGMILKPNGTLSGSPTIAGTYTFNVCATDSVGNIVSPCATTSITAVAAPPPVVTPPSPPTPPVTQTTPNYWVYQNGVFAWPGDFSYAATIDYTDTSGAPTSGTEDIRVTLTSQWGAWQPYAQNFAFDSTAYTKLTFSLKPTRPNQVWQVYFMKIGDVPTGINVNVANYGPAPVVGQWATYTIPLADVGVLGTSIYKFAIQDESAYGSNTWYVDNVGFAP